MGCCSADCTFADFGGNVLGEVKSEASVSLRNCLFTGNALQRGLQYGAILSAVPVDDDYSSTADDGHQPGGFRLEGCTFENNTFPHGEIVLQGVAMPTSPAFYSDSIDVKACEVSGLCQACGPDPVLCGTQLLNPLNATPEGVFLTDEDQELLIIKTVRAATATDRHTWCTEPWNRLQHVSNAYSSSVRVPVMLHLC
jgi:hypothetical protein